MHTCKKSFWIACLAVSLFLGGCTQNSAPETKLHEASFHIVMPADTTPASAPTTVPTVPKPHPTEVPTVPTSAPTSVETTAPTIQATHPKADHAGQKVRLNVPQMIQQKRNYCAPTTVSMMLKSRGITVDQHQLATEMLTDDSFGTHNANAIRILNKHLFGYEYPAHNQAGYHLATVTTSAIDSEDMRLFKERLIQTINEGYPMYYTFDNARVYDKSSGEHNVVGTGYMLDETGKDVAYVYYIDPSYSQQDPVYGGLKRITPEELLYAMLTCVEPNYAW